MLLGAVELPSSAAAVDKHMVQKSVHYYLATVRPGAPAPVFDLASAAEDGTAVTSQPCAASSTGALSEGDVFGCRHWYGRR